MKTVISRFSIFCLVIVCTFNETYSEIKPYFEKNMGQWNKEALYRAYVRGKDYWITNNGVVIDKHYTVYPNKQKNNQILSNIKEETGAIRIGHVISQSYPECSKDVNILGDFKRQSKISYISTKDRSEWQENVPIYDELKVQDIWNGVDIRYYFSDNEFRYDFIVQPNTGINSIKIKIEAGDSVYINSKGNAVIKTQAGDIINKSPVAYQIIGGNKKYVKCKFDIDGNDLIGFVIDNYDKSKMLIIDPTVYSLFLSGSGEDIAYDIESDSKGNAIVAGLNYSKDFPITKGSYCDTVAKSKWTCYGFLTVLNSDGSDLIYSTRFRNFIPYFINLQSDSVMLLCGQFYRFDQSNKDTFPLPIASGYIAPYFKDSTADAGFTVCSFNYKKNSLDFLTLIYSKLGFSLNSMIMDKDKYIYFCGDAKTDLPVTDNAIRKTYQRNKEYPNYPNCSYFLKLSPDCKELLYCSYIYDSLANSLVNDIAVDQVGNIYLSGSIQNTSHNYFPVTEDAYLSKLKDKNRGSGFIQKYNKGGDSLLYSSLIDGSGSYRQVFMKLDRNDDLFVVSSSGLNDGLPQTKGKIDLIDSSYGIAQVAYIMKFDMSQYKLLYTSRFNAVSTVMPQAICIERNDNVILAGKSIGNIWVSDDALQKEPVYEFDGFVTQFDSEFTRYKYSSLMGGSGVDEVTALAVDSSGSIYVTGNTSSPDFPVLPGKYSEAKGDIEVFIVKIDPITDVRDNINSDSFNISPNPARDYTDISVSNRRLKPSATVEADIRIYNVLGECVKKAQPNLPQGEGVRIDVSGLPPGLYLIRYGNEFGKFVKD